MAEGDIASNTLHPTCNMTGRPSVHGTGWHGMRLTQGTLSRLDTEHEHEYGQHSTSWGIQHSVGRIETRQPTDCRKECQRARGTLNYESYGHTVCPLHRLLLLLTITDHLPSPHIPHHIPSRITSHIPFHPKWSSDVGYQSANTSLYSASFFF
jgi:hypothetical protein